MKRWTLVLAVVCGFLFSGCASSRTPSTLSTSVLSNTPVQVCPASSDAFFPPLPGKLTARVDGQQATRFHFGKPFQLIYTPDDPQDQFHSELGVVAIPYFDDALQSQDINSETLTLTDQAVNGTTLTIPVTFPFAHPDTTHYMRPGAYCFQVEIAYVQPDGMSVTGIASLGMESVQ